MRVDHRFAVRGQPPRPREAFAGRLRVLDQALLLQAFHHPRDLTLIGQADDLRDFTVVQTRAPGDRRQRHLRPRRQAGNPPGKPTPTAAEPRSAAPTAPAASARGGTGELARRRRATPVRQHDRRHQLTQQLDQRLGAQLQQARVDHTERRTDHTLRDQPRQHRRRLRVHATLIDHPGQALQHTRATRQHPRTRRERLDEHQTPHRRLTIQRLQQRRQRRANPRGPTQLRLPTRARLELQPVDRVVERRQKTIFAIAEALIERAVGHPRALGDTPRRHTLIARSRRQARTSRSTTGHAADSASMRLAATRATRRHPQLPERLGRHQRPPPTDGSARERNDKDRG